MAITAQLVKELREKTGLGMMDCKKALTATNGDIDAAIQKMREDGALKAEKKQNQAAEGIVITASEGNVAVVIEVNCQTDFVGRDENFVPFANALAQAALSAKTEDTAAVLASKATGFEGTFEEWRLSLISKLGENIQFRRIKVLESAQPVGHYCHRNRIGVLVELDQDNTDLARDVALHIAAINPQCISGDDADPALLEKEKAIFIEQAKQSGKPDNIIEKMIDGRIKKYLKEISLLDQAFVKDPETTVGQLVAKNNAKVLQFVRFELGDGIEIETKDFAEEVKAQVEGSKA